MNGEEAGLIAKGSLNGNELRVARANLKKLSRPVKRTETVASKDIKEANV